MSFRPGTGNPAASMLAAGVKPGSKIVATDLPTTVGEEVTVTVTAIGTSAVLVRRPGGLEFAYHGTAWGPVALLLAALLLAASSSRAQETEPTPEPAPEAEVAEQPEPSPLVAAGWCAVDSGEPAAAEEGDEPTTGCDAGVGVALWTWRRLAPVAVIGTRTVGAGVAYLAYNRVAIALGVVAPYDKSGIHAGGAQLALGATFSFGGPR